MTTPTTNDPIVDCRPKLRIVPLRTGEPQSRVGMIFDEKSGILEWPAGPQGDRGPRGPSSRPWILVGYVTAEASLPTGLTSADVGKAWANTTTKAVHIWQGYRWHDPVPLGLSRPGDAGPPVNLTIGSVATLAVGSDVTASITGTAPDRVLSVGIPRGPVGDKGLTRTQPELTAATDYIGLPPTQGQSLRWDTAASGWVASREASSILEWSLSNAEITGSVGGGTDATTQGTGSSVIATTELPPQKRPYRLTCDGIVGFRHGALVDGASAQDATTVVIVTANYGPGPVQIGRGYNRRNSTESPTGGTTYSDQIEVTGSYLSKVTPASTVPLIPADEEVTVVVTIQRTTNVYWGRSYITPDEFGTAGSSIQLIGMPA